MAIGTVNATDPIGGWRVPGHHRDAILSRTKAKYGYPGNVQANQLLPRPTVPLGQITITNAKSLYIINYRKSSDSTRMPRQDKLQSLLRINIERSLSDVLTIAHHHTPTWTQHCCS